MEWFFNAFKISNINWGIGKLNIKCEKVGFGACFFVNKNLLKFLTKIHRIVIIPLLIIYYFVFVMTKELVGALGNTYHEFNSDGINYWFHNLREELRENFEIENIIKKVASIFHENRRKSRLNMDGTYKPMMEKAEDKEWIKKHWTNLVDIANTKFEDLPSNWKDENMKASEVAVSLVYKKVINREEITLDMIEKMSKIVHEKWLERNWKEWSFENQRVDYKELPEEEKSKDRDQIKIAIKIISEEL